MAHLNYREVTSGRIDQRIKTIPAGRSGYRGVGASRAGTSARTAARPGQSRDECYWAGRGAVGGATSVSKNAITAWRKLIGPTNSEKARDEAPGSVRALWGTDGQRNAAHGSDAPESAARELGLMFSS